MNRTKNRLPWIVAIGFLAGLIGGITLGTPFAIGLTVGIVYMLVVSW